MKEARRVSKGMRSLMSRRARDNSFVGCPRVGDLLLTATFTQAAEPRGAVGLTLSRDDAKGAWIVGVTPGTPAAKARLQPGDRILAIDYKLVVGHEEAIRAIAASKPGSPMRFDIDRQGLQGALWAVVAT